MDVLVIGAGPAGVAAALRAADLGARTTLLTSGAFGGMAANDGPVPVRTLAHAARLIREARQLDQYGIVTSVPVLDYSRLLTRVREVVNDVRAYSAFRESIDRAGVNVLEHAGSAHFIDANTVETADGRKLRADRFILCAGGMSRRLEVPGFELTSTHSDAWGLKSIPPSMLVVGAGATGAQVASIFNAFGSKVQLFEAGPRILPTEDDDVSAAVATAFQASGISVKVKFGSIKSFLKTQDGVRMMFMKDGEEASTEGTLAIIAVGWVADVAGLGLGHAGVGTNSRGYVQVDDYLQTSASHVFAAGDITGRLMLVPQALQDGFTAATNAVLGPTVALGDQISPTGSFTDPEYAQVGLSETKARERHDVTVVRVDFNSTVRTIIDGRTVGFCKLIVDRATRKILGCHVVGERAVDIVQVASLAMAGGLTVDDLTRIPLSFPTYAGILGRAAAKVASTLNPPFELAAKYD